MQCAACSVRDGLGMDGMRGAEANSVPWTLVCLVGRTVETSRPRGREAMLPCSLHLPTEIRCAIQVRACATYIHTMSSKCRRRDPRGSGLATRDALVSYRYRHRRRLVGCGLWFVFSRWVVDLWTTVADARMSPGIVMGPGVRSINVNVQWQSPGNDAYASMPVAC